MQITLPSKTDLDLSGTLTNGESKVLVVICYGYKVTPEHPAIKIVAKDLNAAGYATFVFRFTSDTATDIRGQTQDIEAVAEHFDTRFDKIVLLASSLGALSASIAASRSDKIASLITVNGFFGLAHLGKRFRPTFFVFQALTLLPGEYKKIWQFYKQEFHPNHIKIPTLVIHNPADKDVFISQSRHFYDLIDTKKEFQELPLADHSISLKKDAHAIARAATMWLNRQR